MCCADFKKALEIDPSLKESKEDLARLTMTAGADSRPQETQTAGKVSPEMELEFWNSINDSDEPELFRAYIKQFPNGTFVALAKIRLKKLGKTE